MFCDLHSHSRKTNCFFYGCTVGGNNENHWLEERVIPFLLSNRTDSVSYSDCSFMIHKGRETCGRVVVRKEFNVINSYTLEASFLGSSLGVRRDCHFTPTSLKVSYDSFRLSVVISCWCLRISMISSSMNELSTNFSQFMAKLQVSRDLLSSRRMERKCQEMIRVLRITRNSKEWKSLKDPCGRLREQL